MCLLTESSESSTVMRDQRVWSMKECAQVFSDCLAGLKKEFANQGENGMLVWDKVRHCLDVMLVRDKIRYCPYRGHQMQDDLFNLLIDVQFIS